MSKTLTISDTLYQQLQKSADQRGFQTIEQFLQSWQNEQAQRVRRAATVDKILALRQTLVEEYGQMPNSVELIREDRLIPTHPDLIWVADWKE